MIIPHAIHRFRPTLLVGALAVIGFAGGAGAIDINPNKALGTVKTVASTLQTVRMSEADEIAVGKEIAAQTLGAYPVVRKEKLQRYVNQVGRWIALQSDRPNLPWRFAVVQSEQVNAFAVPGGAVLVTTGMMSLVANEAELACVLGHEIGHITRKHHVNVMEKAVTEGITQLISDNIKSDGNKGLVQQLFLKEGKEIFSRSLDRGEERDADSDGVVLAARAGYDPGACVLLMERMASRKVEANALAALYKTHPQAGERLLDVTTASENLVGASAGDGSRPPLLQRE